MATDLISLNRVQYAGFDFDTISDDLRTQLQINFAASFNDFAVSSLGIVLIDIVAFGLDTLSYYLDRRATDTYLATARTQGAVALLTRQLGYKMAAAVASSVDLSVAPTKSYAFALPIPVRFQFSGPNGTIFEAAQAVTIPTGSTAAVTIPCYQGQTITETFTSDGTPNQIFQLSRVPSGWMMAQGTVTCTVSSSPFTESDFLSFNETDQFEVGYNDTPPTIRFGDGVAGNIPVLNGVIVVTYVATLGTAGEVLSNTITSVVTSLVVNFTTISLSINNPAASIGGSDLEDLEHAKTFAPLVFKSRQVAVTAGDYQALAGSYADPLFGRVAIAEAISSRSATTDIELQNLLNDIENSLTTATLTVQDNAGFNTWASATPYSENDYIVPSPSNGSYYQALSSGQSGGSQPPFPTVVGATVPDGTLMWACQGSVLSNNGLALAGSILTQTTAAASDISNIATNLASVYNNESQLLSLARTIASDATQIGADYGDASATITNAKAAINAFATTGGTTAINISDQANLITYLNTINSLLSLMNGLASNISATSASQSSVVQNNQSTLQFVVGINLTQTGALLTDLNTQVSGVLSDVGVASPATGLFLVMQNILGSSSLNQATVLNDTIAIAAHVNGFLAADCQANLVSVPILAVDTSGFYAAPSIGLINSLQAYLNGIKEVTQTVVVSSGVGFLVPAVLTIRIGVDSGTSMSVAQATAQTIINGTLMGRPFGLSLYISDITEPLDEITGVHFVNATIVGYRPVGNPSIFTDLLDVNGNLIVSTNQVVTLSVEDLAINVEVYTGPA
jgi:hypothetical protein